MLTPRYETASISAALATLLVLGQSGCARAKAIPVVPSRPLRAATVAEVLAAHDEYCRGTESLIASGDIEVRDLRAGKARRLGVRLVAARGGRLYLKASVAVMTALELSADGRRFSFQVPARKTVWTGSSDVNPRAEDEKAPYYALRPGDVVAALVPDPLAPRAGEELVLEADRETFSLTLAPLKSGGSTARRRVWLDRETLRLARSRSYDERGDVLMEASFARWEEGSPRQVLVARPRDGYEAAFDFDKVQRNVAAPEKAFVPRTPEGYKVVEVE